ncbi:MAG: hypothetical protein NTW83_10595, partial [Cyanobacteria bacterium]|nr:hypothetical protein [Cyanobacteriota bacterium]
TVVAVYLISPDHPNYGSDIILSNRNMGGAELMAILPAQGLLGDLIRTYLKTDKYIKQNTGGEDEGLQEILRIRGLQNSQRRSEITSLTSDLLRKAPLFVSGNRLEVGEGDPQNRFSKAYQELIRSAFPSLRMVRKAYNEGTLLKALQDQDDILEGSDLELSEAEQELFNEIRRRKKLEGDRLMVSDLVTRFEQRGYGWPAWATLTFLARLFKLGKLELWQQSTPLAGHEVGPEGSLSIPLSAGADRHSTEGAERKDRQLPAHPSDRIHPWVARCPR